MKNLLALAIGVSLSFLGPAGLQAATFVVDRFGDSASYTQCNDVVEEDCSLRGAIIRANQWPGVDTIEFDLPFVPPFFLRTIYLSLTGSDENDCLVGDLDITEGVTIDGGGWVEIDGSQLGDRVLEVVSSVSGEVVLRGLKIQGGSGVSIGGGFRLNYGSDLVLEQVEVRDNSANLGGGGYVASGGRLVIIDSTLMRNHAQAATALAVLGEAHISNSTISGNSGTSISNPISVAEEAALLWLHHSTIADNDLGANDIAVHFCGGATAFDVRGSIIEGVCWDHDSAAVISSGGNIESPGNTCGLNPAIDQVNVADPGLWPLGYHGGTTPTLVPGPASPAVDDPLGVLGTCSVDDQRGLPRSVDGNGDGVVGCDSGAVERQPDEPELFFDGFESGDTSRW